MGRVSVEPLDADILVADHAFGIMRLEGEGPFIQHARVILAWLGAERLGVLEQDLVVDLHRHFPSLADDVLGPPLVILGGCCESLNLKC
jgi:hypothetical protein